MAYSPLPSRAPTAAPISNRSLSDMVARAAAILVRETPVATVASPVAAMAGDLGNPAASIEQVHQRAMAVLSDLFSLLGAQPPGTDSLARSAESVARSALDVPWRWPANPASAGTATSIPLRLENLEDRPVQVSFYSSDLLSDAGGSIPSFAVSFDPATLNLGAGQQGAVTANVDVPAQAVPGAYSGLVQAAGISGLKAVITVEIC